MVVLYAFTALFTSVCLSSILTSTLCMVQVSDLPVLHLMTSFWNIHTYNDLALHCVFFFNYVSYQWKWQTGFVGDKPRGIQLHLKGETRFFFSKWYFQGHNLIFVVVIFIVWCSAVRNRSKGVMQYSYACLYPNLPQKQKLDGSVFNLTHMS